MPEYEKLTAEQVARIVGQGGLHTRLSIARELGRDKTTYLISIIDLGAAQGLYKKVLMTDGIGEFWAYTVDELQDPENDY
jgi:hypothetical protein